MTTRSNLGTNNGWRPNAALVRRDALGPVSPEDAVRLRMPQHLDEWRELLCELIQKTLNEVTDSRSKVALTADNREDHKSAIKTHAIIASRAMHVRQLYEARLRECKRLQRLRDDARQRNGIDEQALRLAVLEVKVASLERNAQAGAANVEDAAEVAS